MRPSGWEQEIRMSAKTNADRAGRIGEDYDEEEK